MKTKYFALAIAPALALTIAVGASAQFNTQQRGEGRMQRGGQMQEMMQNITNSVEKTSNGIIVTTTSDDADMVAKLQAGASKRSGREGENVTVTITNISNGIITTTTTDDADILAKLHERADNPGEGRIAQRIKGGGKGERGGALQNVERVSTNISNGVEITMTADDADTIEKLQSMSEREGKNQSDKVTTTRTTLSNGVKITMTSDDADVVAKLQMTPEERQANREAVKDSMTKTVTNLENGVKVTLTSTDADVVTKMQEREPREPQNEEINHTQSNITNGVEITITTDNDELVERIQTRAERDGKSGRGMGKGRGGERGAHGEPHTREDEEDELQ